jgi:hypothetical protein
MFFGLVSVLMRGNWVRNSSVSATVTQTTSFGRRMEKSTSENLNTVPPAISVLVRRARPRNDHPVFNLTVE